ncbi:nucleotidyl transferase AbiEii/AbiGii toxin family protein, partial [bacterium]|nr:nucleotidyl transferase AbiEii/AbiGii toxin family protein [bacterium]
MIDKKSFDKEFIELQIKKYPYVDPAKMETTIFAFGLLDELIKNGLPFIFKGGTSLLLLLDDPKRVSTDIDIIVPIEVEFDSFFDRVKKRFPFYEGEERGDTSNPCFRHFYFMFRGPISNKECRINLDVAFEDNPYPKTLEKEVSMPFLLTRGQKTYVSIPSCESILGDKLTAFAPRTIGVNPFATSMGKPMDNRLQVMKQFYDIARL